MKAKKHSPLKDKPLRYPGQSLDERRNDVLYDQLLTPLLAALFACFLALNEWWRDFRQIEPHPGLFITLAALSVMYLVWKFRRAFPEIRRLRLASEGEKVVGQYLEQLRQQGYQIYHDIIGHGFNIDHVLIGPAGIFTIETKTRSKPSRRDARVVFDGAKILVDGHAHDRDPVAQAKAQAGWLHELLAQSTGRKFKVKPVIVFPGWYVEQGRGTTREMWVLEPKALPGFLAHEPQVLAPADVALAGFHLGRFVRAGER